MTDPEDDEDAAPGREHDQSPMPELRNPPPNPRKALPFLITPIIAMIVMNNLGNIFFAPLLEQKPALLLVLNSQNRYLALTTVNLEALPYFGIGFLRLVAPDPLFYLLGFWYGETVIRWIERKSQTYGLAIRQMEKAFDKASWVVVTVFPNNFVCLIAGTARTAPVLFAILNVIGTIGRLILFRIFGIAFQEQLESIVGFITRYRWPLLAVSAVLVGFTVFNDWRTGRGQIESLIDLEHEIETDFEPDERRDSS